MNSRIQNPQSQEDSDSVDISTISLSKGNLPPEELIDPSLHFQFVYQKTPSDTVSEEKIEPGKPHEALFYVLTYLPLLELLKMTKVCKSLRDGINNDVLLWRDIFVETPLNLRITDDILLKITSKADGRLRTLALMHCGKITDHGLQRVVEKNPYINKLYVPGSTSLTPDGMVKIVKRLTEHKHELKYLKVHSLFNTRREHLETLSSCLKINPLATREMQKPKMFLDFKHFSPQKREDPDHEIDIDICPKCNEVRLVFECPREMCKRRKMAVNVCRGCDFCIPRCEHCGGCIDFEEELEETVCNDIVCSECWLKLPKCSMCNRPYCNRHSDQGKSTLGEPGFICSICSIEEGWEEFGLAA